MVSAALVKPVFLAIVSLSLSFDANFVQPKLWMPEFTKGESQIAMRLGLSGYVGIISS